MRGTLLVSVLLMIKIFQNILDNNLLTCRIGKGDLITKINSCIIITDKETQLNPISKWFWKHLRDPKWLSCWVTSSVKYYGDEKYNYPNWWATTSHIAEFFYRKNGPPSIEIPLLNITSKYFRFDFTKCRNHCLCLNLAVVSSHWISKLRKNKGFGRGNVSSDHDIKESNCVVIEVWGNRINVFSS